MDYLKQHIIDQKVTIERIDRKLDSIHDRVYNGIGKEIRDEVNKEVSVLRSLILGVLIALVLSLAGIVIEGRVSSGQASSENNRNYKAIIDLDMKLHEHINEPRD